MYIFLGTPEIREATEEVKDETLGLLELQVEKWAFSGIQLTYSDIFCILHNCYPFQILFCIYIFFIEMSRNIDEAPLTK